MPRKSPIGMIKDAALDTIKDPVGAAGKAAGRAVGQARDSVALGRTVAGHVSRGAYGLVRSRLGIHEDAPSGDAGPVTVNRPRTPTSPTAPSAPPAVPAEEPLKDQGDALATTPSTRTVKKPTARTAKTPSSAAARTAKKTARTTGTTTAKKAPSRSGATDAPEVTATPADVAEKVAKKAPAKKTGTKKAPTARTAAKKTPAQKTAARKTAAASAPRAASTTSSPSDKLPVKKSPVKKSPAKKGAARKSPARERPLTAEELAAGAGTETITPVGTRGADVATNPDTTETDLQQPGTEPLMDPAATKSVAKEAKTLGRASDPDKS